MHLNVIMFGDTSTFALTIRLKWKLFIYVFKRDIILKLKAKYSNAEREEFTISSEKLTNEY